MKTPNQKAIASWYQRKTFNILIPILLVLLTIVSVDQWSSMPFGNTAIKWTIRALLIIAFFIEKSRNNIKFSTKAYFSVTIFLIVALYGIYRGTNTAENYWEWKNLVNNSFILLLPTCVYAFNQPMLICRSMKLWLRIALPLYAIGFVWVISISQFYLGPIYLIGCFLPLIPKNHWKIIVLVLLTALLVYKYQDSRSQSIKAGVALFFSIICLLHRFIPTFVMKLMHWAFYATACVLLYLGLNGQYNIFEATSNEYGGVNYIEITEEDGEEKQVDIAADTRTFIYKEVIYSAINNDYIVWGRTPARGNDTDFFYDIADDLKSKHFEYNIKHERPMNEVCFPNIFTWLGLVGMIAYILIYLQASVLALYRSNNDYVKIMGLYTAFNFMYGWVENATNVDILNITYWLAIGMCMSPHFRNMTNREFKKWFVSIFNIRQQPTHRINPYLP